MVAPRSNLPPEAQPWGRYITDLVHATKAVAERAEKNIAANGKQVTAASNGSAPVITALSAEEINNLTGRVAFSNAATGTLTTITSTQPTILFGKALAFDLDRVRKVQLDASLLLTAYAEDTDWAQFGLTMGIRVNGAEPAIPSPANGVYLPATMQTMLRPPATVPAIDTRVIKASALLTLPPGAYSITMVLRGRTITTAGDVGELVQLSYSSDVKTAVLMEAL
jgi:hypothetical protein